MKNSNFYNYTHAFISCFKTAIIIDESEKNLIMKNNIPLLIAFFAYFNICIGQTNNNNVFLRLENTETATEIKSKVIAYNVQDVIGFQFALSFDSTVIKAAPIVSSTLINPTVNTHFNKKQLNIVWFSPDNIPIGKSSLVLLEVVFTKVKDSPAQLAINPSIFPVEFVGSDNKIKTVTILGSVLNTATIKGKLTADVNKNCQIDTGDKPIRNVEVKATSVDGDYWGFSDNDGNYEIYILDETKSYTVSVQEDTKLWNICQDDVVLNSVSLTNNTVNFSLKGIFDCPVNKVKISNAILRRCFTNTYYLDFSNNGTEDSQNTYSIVTLDDDLILESASLPYTDLGNHQYRFELGTIGFQQNKQLTLEVKVNCTTTVLGQIHCVEAEVYPTTNCVDHIIAPKINAVCDGDKVKFEVENDENTPFSNGSYIIIEDDMIFRQGIIPTLNPGEKFNTDVIANGSTWRMETRQNNKLIATTFYEGCGTNAANQFSVGYADIFPQVASDLNKDKLCVPNRGSYDPNDKQGFPIGVSQNHFIEPNTPIEYLIRFQNTGTDVAFNVVVEEVIDMQKLDVSSIRILGASHNYTFSIKNRNMLVFDFKDINLIDSFHNEKLSHGFIRFVINQHKDVALGNVIKNKAAIFFDFNLPIITNETYHTIGRAFLAVASNEVFDKHLKVSLQPNPIVEQAQLVIEGINTQEYAIDLEVFDLLGKKVMQQNTSNDRFTINKSDLQTGIYLYRIAQNNRIVASGKMIIE